MEHQRVTKPAQKQPETCSSSLHQTSLNHVAVHPLLELQRVSGNQIGQSLPHSGNVQSDPTTQALREPRFSHDFSQTPVHSLNAPVLQTRVSPFSLQTSSNVRMFIQRSLTDESIISPSSKQGVREDMEWRIHSASAKGSVLPPHIRHPLEEHLGTDLSRVRVHTDSEAAHLARSVNALAFTFGQNIFFGENRYNPNSANGIHLLTHEIIHTAQQASSNMSGVPASTNVSIGDPSDCFEREADRITNQVMSTEASLDSHRYFSPGLISQLRTGLAINQSRISANQHLFEPNQPETAKYTSLHSGKVHIQLAPDPQARGGKPHSIKQSIQNLERENKNLAHKAQQADNRGREIALLSSFQSDVLARFRDWQNAAFRIGSAYATAVNNHKSILESRASEQALENAVFAMILTVATAGTLSWLGQVIAVSTEAAASSAKSLLVIPRPVLIGLDGALLESTANKVPRLPSVLNKGTIETATQAAASEVIDIDQQARQPSAQSSNDDPLVHQNKKLSAITIEEGVILGKFSKLFQDLATLPLSAFDEFDAEKSMDKYHKCLALADQFAGTKQLPDDTTMERELERGIWAVWVPRYLVEERTVRRVYHGDMFDFPETIYHNPGTAMEHQFDKLGITKASGVNDFGWWTSDSEIELVIGWAKGYTPSLTKPHSY